MANLEIKWGIDEQTGKKYLTSDVINQHIEINEDTKEIKKTKAFFRQIVFYYFLNDCDDKIILVDNDDLEIVEVKTIINEIIDVCNAEIEQENHEEE